MLDLCQQQNYLFTEIVSKKLLLPSMFWCLQTCPWFVTVIVLTRMTNHSVDWRCKQINLSRLGPQHVSCLPPLFIYYRLLARRRCPRDGLLLKIRQNLSSLCVRTEDVPRTEDRLLLSNPTNPVNYGVVSLLFFHRLGNDMSHNVFSRPCCIGKKLKTNKVENKRWRRWWRRSPVGGCGRPT